MDELIKQDIKVDAIITDEPYGTTKCKWDSVIPFELMWDKIHKLSNDKTPIVLFGSQPFTSSLVMSNIKEFKHDWIWHKSRSGSAITAKYRPIKIHEDILVFCKTSPTYNPQMQVGEPYFRKPKRNNENNHQYGIDGNAETTNIGTRYPITIQYFKQNWSRQQQIHPTQKPVELMEYLIKTYSNENDVVLDFTMGSGSTGVACMNTNRKFIGIEKEITYCDISKQRIVEALGMTE
jgi:DNA modification methylase